MGALQQVGFERITALSSVQSLTVPTKAQIVWLQAETNDVRVTWDDGTTTPTATVGSVIRADDPPMEVPVDLALKARLIEETASAQLSVTYFGS